MGFVQKDNNKLLVLRILFLVIPTILVLLITSWLAQYNILFLKDVYWQQWIVITIGILLSTIVHNRHWRLLPILIFIILIGSLISYLLKISLDGELTPIYISYTFSAMTTGFILGWIIGFSLYKWSAGGLLIGSIILLLNFYLLSQQYDRFINYNGALLLLGNATYFIYIIYASTKLHNAKSASSINLRSLMIGFTTYGILSIITIFSIIKINEDYIEQTLQNITKGNYNDANQMLKNGDNGMEFNESNSLKSSNKRENKLLLVAYINNFFPNSTQPNPLYLTTFYYPQFDSLTETFLKVDNMPDKDLFQPQPGNIPLYHIQSDSSVLAFGANDSMQHIVEVEVYNKALNPNEFVAPSTAFMVQPIAVNAAYQKEYKSAYRAKSRVSVLNSAFFIYNIDAPEIAEFQEERFKILRKVESFNEMPEDVYKYYTHIPKIESITPIRNLAIEITKSATLPIDKVIAIRDFFLKKDANGKTIFKYSDNPGIPDIPSASKINHFLFETKKGYCAHYAASTLFMLRSLGIPSRITAGLLTEDRSTTNKGWYYFYADQVHAWVQIYFPGLGWIDFDTTVGNDEAHESDQPDGTPPIQPSKAALATNGTIANIEYNKGYIDLALETVIANDQTYTISNHQSIMIDATHAAISKQNTSLKLEQLKIGDTVTIVVYNESEAFKKNINIENSANILYSLQKPIAADVIQLFQKSTEKKKNVVEKAVPRQKMPYSLIILISILLLIGVFSSYIIYQYYKWKAKNKKTHINATASFIWIRYYLQIIGLEEQRDESLQQYFNRIDKLFNTNITSFYWNYNELKYNKTNSKNYNFYNNAQEFINIIDAKLTKKQRTLKWLQYNRMWHFIFDKIVSH